MPTFSQLKKGNRIDNVARPGVDPFLHVFYSPGALGLLWMMVVLDAYLLVAGGYLSNEGGNNDKLDRIKITSLVFLYITFTVDLIILAMTKCEAYTTGLVLIILGDFTTAVLATAVDSDDYTGNYAVVVLFIRITRVLASSGYVQYNFFSLLWIDEEWHPGAGPTNPLEQPLLAPVWSREQDNKLRELSTKREKQGLTHTEEDEMEGLAVGFEAFNEAGMSKINASPPSSPKAMTDSPKAKPTFENPEPPSPPPFDSVPAMVSVISCKGCGRGLKLTQGSPGSVLCPVCQTASPVSRPASSPSIRPPIGYPEDPPSPPPYQAAGEGSPPGLPAWDAQSALRQSVESPLSVFKCKGCSAPLLIRGDSESPSSFRNFKCHSCLAVTSVRSSASPSRMSGPESFVNMPSMAMAGEWYEPPSRAVPVDAQFRTQLGNKLQEAESLASQSGKREPQHLSWE
eukprot:TRINITY_DN6533_c6_g1_i1.p1 TRINITY_DN6533_c6_g1~~TRINITY_DN6533_c6_g1_i1.p1  ORF type:complete len:456 (+),score=29.16 TRINITY_DN6533_c6_g1_i1:121-1488(+)